VLAFDFRNNGHSAYPTKNPLAYRRDFAAAIKQLRGGGARRVFLIGASMGGAAAVQNSGGLPLTGVVSLSGTRLWSGFGINKPGPRALRAPFLYVGTKERLASAAQRSALDRPPRRLARQAQPLLPRVAARLAARAGRALLPPRREA
jgi:pimeloyl-ACP methyl ester carboxylesterase